MSALYANGACADATAAAVGMQGEQPAGKWAPMAADKVVALGKHYAVRAPCS